MGKIIFFLTAFCLIGSASYAQNKNSYSFAYLNDSLTLTGSAGAVQSNFNSSAPFKYFSLAVNPTQGSGAWSVALQGSLDNVTWTNIVVNSSVTYSAGQVVSNVNPVPSLYLRTYASSLAVGTTVTAVGLGVW